MKCTESGYIFAHIFLGVGDTYLASLLMDKIYVTLYVLIEDVTLKKTSLYLEEMCATQLLGYE